MSSVGRDDRHAPRRNIHFAAPSRRDGDLGRADIFRFDLPGGFRIEIECLAGGQRAAVIVEHGEHGIVALLRQIAFAADGGKEQQQQSQDTREWFCGFHVFVNF